jgi:hypothetical protein
MRVTSNCTHLLFCVAAWEHLGVLVLSMRYVNSERSERTMITEQNSYRRNFQLIPFCVKK